MAEATFPTALDDYNTYYTIAIPYLDANSARLNVDASKLSDLNDFFDEPASGTGWLQVYPLTTDRATATGTLRDQRDDLIEDIDELLREIYQNVPEADLTQTDRAKLRIFEDAAPSERTAIQTAPDVALTAMEGGRIRQRLRVDEDADRASRHPDATGWERVSKIGGPPPANPGACPIKETGTRALTVIDPGTEHDGERYYCFVRWVIFGQEEKNGPWSGMEVITISAGTVGS